MKKCSIGVKPVFCDISDVNKEVNDCLSLLWLRPVPNQSPSDADAL